GVRWRRPGEAVRLPRVMPREPSFDLPDPADPATTAPRRMRSPAAVWVLGLGLLALVAGAHEARAAGAYVRNERFDAMATGLAPTSPWTITSTGGGSVTVREVPFPADKSVKIQKLATTGTSSLSLTFADQSGRVVVESKVMARETAGFKAIPYVYDASG